jgi:hypothetical protein
VRMGVGWDPARSARRLGRTRRSTYRTVFRILGLVSIPDARRSTHGVSWKERRTGPRHAAVWVRVGGRWRKGRIIEWIRELGRDGWECVILAEEPHGGPLHVRPCLHPASPR